MKKENYNKIYVIDSSAILTGKQIDLSDSEICTTVNLEKEFARKGKDQNNFIFLKQKGLKFFLPEKESIEIIKNKAKETNDYSRLSSIDIEILALAYEIEKSSKNKVIILTDDYSIQNVANFLQIEFETIDNSGITKRFKWKRRCRGCGRNFKEDIYDCPICGSETRYVVSSKRDLEK